MTATSEVRADPRQDQPYELPLMLSIALPERDGNPGMTIMAQYDEELGRYVNRNISITSVRNPVTSTLVKGVPIHRLVVAACLAQLAKSNEPAIKAGASPAVKAFFRDRNGARPAARYIDNPSEAQLRDVATIQILARCVRAYPNVSVARSFGLTLDEAKRWGRLAKKAGYL